MEKEKIMQEVQRHYDGLEEMGFNVVGAFLYGSQNYRMDYEGSDVDTKAIILPSLEDIVHDRRPVSTTIDLGQDGLCDVKDIREMFKCFKKQNINFVELLFTEYYVLNPKYKTLYQPMLDNAESLSRYNNYASVNCISGMAYEKRKAMTHPYPSLKHKIDKYGYDNKQLHHILRMRDFIQRYVSGETYKSILIPSNREEILKVKTEYIYSLQEAKDLATVTCSEIASIKDGYMSKNELQVNKEMGDLMNNVLTSLISHSIQQEVCLSAT